MEKLRKSYNQYISVVIESSVQEYLEGATRNKDYLLYADSGSYNYVVIKIMGTTGKHLAHMSGHYIQFYNYDHLLLNADNEDENFYNLASNVEKYIDQTIEPQNIYFNLFINANMPFVVEGELYILLKDMLYTLHHYDLDYIAGYIRKEAYELVKDELTSQGYVVINTDDECLELLCKVER